MKYRIRKEVTPDRDYYYAQKTDCWWPFTLAGGSWTLVDDCYEVEYGSMHGSKRSLEAAKANIDHEIAWRKKQEDYVKKCRTEYIKYP